ncbi:hypothetical protein CPB83DRAFT_850279 [Crepidotus variabilis]|uniref:Uncharacterized protein n=1 Tax=Crepidotus variabilis TaxID=179855 RepID=A0A9P6EL34_9AGAR|nr:hypothetical protein CPB83DRAFT_850279 [Crepidotus variabilis]
MTNYIHSFDDSTRLPAGFKRIAYDADSGRYTFRDRTDGKLYIGKPGEEYGVMMPIDADRPQAFAADNFADDENEDDEEVSPGRIIQDGVDSNHVGMLNSSSSTPSVPVPRRKPTTFHDILPPTLIRAAANMESTASSSQSTGSPPTLKSRWKSVVQGSILPSMRKPKPQPSPVENPDQAKWAQGDGKD